MIQVFTSFNFNLELFSVVDDGISLEYPTNLIKNIVLAVELIDTLDLTEVLFFGIWQRGNQTIASSCNSFSKNS